MMEQVLTMQSVDSLRKKKKGKYVIKQRDMTSRIIYTVLLLFGGICIYFLGFMCDYQWDQVRPDLIVSILVKFFDYSSISMLSIKNIALSLCNTLLLAFMTTIIGTFIGLILGLGAARNLSNPWLSNIIRGIAGFIRAVPTIIWTILFVSGFGLSATTAIVGMSFHSIAYFIKSYSEAFEEVDTGTIEALRATGSSWGQIVTSAVLPTSFTKIISWIAMRSEMNFAAAVIIGPAVGVPGTIGSILNQFARGGNYGGLGLCILVIFLSALTFEIFLTKYKQRTLITNA